jgi:hypothetical protein
MKYLKIFESFTSDKFEEQIEDLFIGITDDLGAGIQVVMDQFTNAGPRMERLQVKILLPHGYEHSPMDVYYKIRNELVPIHNKIMRDYGLKFSGCSQLKRANDPNYYGVVSLVYYKYDDQKQFEGFEYHGPQYAKNICDGWGVDLEDIEDLFIDFADEGQVLIHPMIVNKELKVTVHSIWKDLNDSDWLYNPLWDERFNSIKRKLKQMGLDITLETKNLPQRFASFRIGIWLGHLKTESFGKFQLDRITKQEYNSILDNNPLVYMPESKVLEFKSKLSKEYKLLYARGDKKDTVEYFRAEYETEINYHFTCKNFSIKKKSLGEDEPCYIMFYNYEEFTSHAAPKSHIETLPEQKRKSFQKKSYYRFEESDFNQMCKNPQILLDYLNNLDLS